MAKNRLTDVRNHLFEALEGLTDKENPMDLDRARTISKVAQTIIESAKVEVAFMKEIGRSTEDKSTFFDDVPVNKPPLRIAK